MARWARRCARRRVSRALVALALAAPGLGSCGAPEPAQRAQPGSGGRGGEGMASRATHTVVGAGRGVALAPAGAPASPVATGGASAVPAAPGWPVTGVRLAGGAAPAEVLPWRAALPAALAQARSVWGDPAPTGVTVVVPADDAEYARETGGPSSGGAASVFDDRSGSTRIVVAPHARLTGTERTQVLAHELAHAGQRRHGRSGTGGWVLEGTAMLTQYVGVDPATSPETLLVRSESRAGRVPARPPAHGSFAAGEASRLSYQQAWTLCAYLEREHGRAALVRLATAVARGQAEDDALVAVTGRPVDATMRGWAAWIRTWG